MDLLEYQVKEWFQEMDIPVLPSQTIDHPTDLKRLRIGYPIVLKSQIHAGDRAKAGGVRFVETTIDAIAAAQTIFNLPILGELPEVLLAETKYDTETEFYLAVVLDTAVCRPVLLGCKEADIDWESAGQNIQHVVVEQEFSPFYARRLALKMGLHGALMQSIANVIEKMYQLFEKKDLDLVEINPLGVNSCGQLMALNGKVRVNERAIRRHPEIVGMAAKMLHGYPVIQGSDNFITWEGSSSQGKIAIVGDGAGSVMATLDLIVDAGGKPGICMNLRHRFPADTLRTTFKERLEQALEILANDRSNQVILINFLGSIPEAAEVAEVITNFLQQYVNKLQSQLLRTNGSKNRRSAHIPHLVIRLVGSQLDEAQKYLATLKSQSNAPILLENLDEAVIEAVQLTKSTVNKKS
ncbi:MAG: succinate--CoA ligase subunit beta [Nostocaceae cyanobacterium]|nr:succinate--CoA ligase subunit beta [Nostocaceae cyanobacterium]